MQGTPSVLQKVFTDALGPEEAEALAAALRGGDATAADRLVDLVRRLSVLAKVADLVTQELSLDHQLPRLIALIADALEAERATLFLHDSETHELFSRVTRGEGVVEIRIPEGAGIAGFVFGSGTAEIIATAYDDPRFNREVDRRTGYRTRNILSVPLRNRSGGVIGVTQVLNKRAGGFTELDLSLLEAINHQASSALEQSRLVERLEQQRREESELLAITEAISTELQLDTLLDRIMRSTSQLLDCERSTLFVYDAATDELWSRVAEGAGQRQIRIPAANGIAGAAFTSGEVMDIPDAYADAHFNPEIDRISGFRTRNILSMPIIDRLGERLGVVQVLNKRGGPFTPVDRRRLKAFSAGIAIAIQNAQLFSDVLALKNYNESILRSLTNGVVTLDEKLTIIKVNDAAQNILGLDPEAMVNRKAKQVFGNHNPWVTRSLEYVVQSGANDYHADTDLLRADGSAASVNLTTAPLLDLNGKPIGYMLVLDDITREKRVRNTMARYMAKEVVDRLLASGEDVLQGASYNASVLFSDIRGFTVHTEAMTPRETVAMLNDYFTEMVEVVFGHGGMLDKYMGDALMATFGGPVSGPADADNAVLVARDMIRALRQLNKRRAAKGLPPIEIGVGLATGEVMAGSVGSVRRMEYTVIGDVVNLAARLESANKHYGTSVLLSGATVDALKSRFTVRRLDLIQVKGKSQPTLVYESLAHHTRDSFPHLARLVAAYEAGLDRFQQRDWTGALAQFTTALELAANDRPSRIMLDRCRYYQSKPPPDDWNGVWIMQQK